MPDAVEYAVTGGHDLNLRPDDFRAGRRGLGLSSVLLCGKIGAVVILNFVLPLD